MRDCGIASGENTTVGAAKKDETPIRQKHRQTDDRLSRRSVTHFHTAGDAITLSSLLGANFLLWFGSLCYGLVVLNIIWLVLV